MQSPEHRWNCGLSSTFPSCSENISSLERSIQSIPEPRESHHLSSVSRASQCQVNLIHLSSVSRASQSQAHTLLLLINLLPCSVHGVSPGLQTSTGPLPILLRNFTFWDGTDPRNVTHWEPGDYYNKAVEHDLPKGGGI